MAVYYFVKQKSDGKRIARENTQAAADSYDQGVYETETWDTSTDGAAPDLDTEEIQDSSSFFS